MGNVVAADAALSKYIRTEINTQDGQKPHLAKLSGVQI